MSVRLFAELACIAPLYDLLSARCVLQCVAFRKLDSSVSVAMCSTIASLCAIRDAIHCSLAST